MNEYNRNTVGVDISKAYLDVHRLAPAESARFDNHRRGFEALAKWVGPSVEAVIYEPTGPWHRDFEEALAGRLPRVRVNPMRARRFAQASGQQAKTDAIDAHMLSRMGAAMPMRPVPVPSPTHQELDELQTARDGLMKDRTATVNRQKTVRHKLLKRQLKQRLTQIDRQIGAIDEAVGKLIASDDGLARKSEVLTSIPGIGAVTAAGLLTELPELGQIDGKAIASLTGLAPMTCQSGQWKGHSFIRGGRARPRRMLYMAALSAIQHHPELSSKYADLKKRGKPSKLALTAIMRKLIVLANALVKQDRRWTPAAA